VETKHVSDDEGRVQPVYYLGCPGFCAMFLLKKMTMMMMMTIFIPFSVPVWYSD
jgi:hypothetical protein